MTSRRFLRLLVPGALIVSAVLLIRLQGDDSTVERGGLMFAGEKLARALDRSAEEPGTRVVKRFADAEGVPCRVFLGGDVSGIACRREAGWHLRVARSGIDLDDAAATARTEEALLRSAAQMQDQ
jgi:hypothetical protein